MENKKDKTKERLMTAAKTAVAIVLFVVILVNYETLENLDVRAVVESIGSAGAAVAAVLGIYLVKSLTLVVPASLIYISVGMAFESWQAILINTAGICIEITATYFLGKFLGGESVEKLIKKQKNGDKLLNFKRKGKYSFVFLLRFLPLPLDFTSLFLGASDFPFPSYFFMSLLGVMPRVAVLTVLGYGIYNLIPMRLIIIAVLCAIPIALVAWLVTKTVRQRAVPKK